MAKQKNKKFFINPLRNPGIGLRSGKDIKAGKIIRVDEHGFENFEDYFSESDADITRELNKTATVAPKNVRKEVTKPVLRNVVIPQGSSRIVSVSNSTVTSELSKDSAFVNPLEWLRNPDIGRRTGRNIREGKVIRKDEAGFEYFEDYWSESEAESLMMSKSRISFNKTTSVPSEAEKTCAHAQDPEEEKPDEQELQVKESETTTDNSSNISSDHVTANPDSDIESSSCHDVDKENNGIEVITSDAVVENPPTEMEKFVPRPVLVEKVIGTSSLQKSFTGQNQNKSLSVNKSVSHTRSTSKDKSTVSVKKIPDNSESIEKIPDNSEHLGITANTNTAAAQEMCTVDKTQVTDHDTKVAEKSRPCSQIRSLIEIGGNVTGSITKCDDQGSDSAEVAMNFKTRKRLSYSVAEQTPNSKKASYKSTTESIQEEDHAKTEADGENVVDRRMSRVMADNNPNSDSDASGTLLSLMVPSADDKNVCVSSAEEDIVIVDDVVEFTGAEGLLHENWAKKRKSAAYNKRKSEIEKRRSAVVAALMHEYNMDSFSSQEEEIRPRKSLKKRAKSLQHKSLNNTARKLREKKVLLQDTTSNNTDKNESVKRGKSRGRQKNNENENNAEIGNDLEMDDKLSGKQLDEKNAQKLDNKQLSGAKYQGTEVKTSEKYLKSNESNSAVSNLQKTKPVVTKSGKQKARSKKVVKSETQNRVSSVEDKETNEEIETTTNKSTSNATITVDEIIFKKNRRKTFTLDSADEDSDTSTSKVDSKSNKSDIRNTIKKTNTSVSVANSNESDDTAKKDIVRRTNRGKTSNKKMGKHSLSESFDDTKQQSDGAKCSVTENSIISNTRFSFRENEENQSTIHRQHSNKTLQHQEKLVNSRDDKKSKRKRSLKYSKSPSLENITDEIEYNEGLEEVISEMKTKEISAEKNKNLNESKNNETVSNPVVSIHSNTGKRTKMSVVHAEINSQTKSKTQRNARKSRNSVTSSEEAMPHKNTPDKKLRKSSGLSVTSSEEVLSRKNAPDKGLRKSSGLSVTSSEEVRPRKKAPDKGLRKSYGSSGSSSEETRPSKNVPNKKLQKTSGLSVTSSEGVRPRKNAPDKGLRKSSGSSGSSSEEAMPCKNVPDKGLLKNCGSSGTEAVSAVDVDDALETDDRNPIDSPFGDADEVDDNYQEAMTEIQASKIVSKPKKRAETSLKSLKQSRQNLSGIKTRKRSRSRSLVTCLSRSRQSKKLKNATKKLEEQQIVKVPPSKKPRKSSEVSQSMRKMSIYMTSPVGCSTRISNMMDTSATSVQDISASAMEQIFSSGVSFRQKSILKKDKVDDTHRQPAEAASSDDDVEPEADVGSDDEEHVIPHKVSRKSPKKAVPKSSAVSSSALNLTPCIVKPGDKRRKKQRRVTISKLVQQKSYNVSSDCTGAEQTLNNLTMSSAPVHIFETTTSATPQPISKPQKSQIILPEPERNGLRRSQRTRVKPLEWYKGERVRYKPRESGGFLISGVIPSREKDILEMEEKKRKLRQKRNQRKKKTTVRGSPPRNLSMHTEIPSELELTINDEAVVVNPDTEEAVYVEIFAPKDMHVFVGPTGEEPRVSDPFLMSRVLDQKAFGTGVLLLRPLKEKPTQLVNKGSLILVLERGKVCATIHRTSLLMEAGDSCFIPRGNTYSLKNLREEEAKFYYTIIKQWEESELSDHEEQE